jgi:hypothetical protein
MPLKKPNADDVRKIGLEINQIVNQRFLITTLAITMFGVIIAWMIPKTAPTPGDAIGGITFALAILLSLLLFVLYLWSHFLKHTMRIFTSYLMETESSNWEIDWTAYRDRGYFTYTKTQTIIFLLLNVVAFISPLLFAEIFALKLEPVGGLIFCLGVGIVTEAVMYFMGFHSAFDSERRAVDAWKMLNRK